MLFLRLLSAVLQRLPLSLSMLLGEWLGIFAYFAVPSRRRTALNNLRLSLGNEKSQAELNRIAWEMAKNIGKNTIEFFRLPMITPKNIDNYVEFKGLENLQEALKLNRGAFMLTAHFGNWELALAAMVVKGYSMSLVTKYLKNEMLNQFWLESRRKLGINVFYREGSLKEIIRALKANGLMGFVLDQNTKREEGVFVNFFGRPACTIPSLAVLSQRLETPVVPTFIIRKPNGRHCLTFGKHLMFSQTSGSQDPIVYNTQVYTDVIERYIRQYPEQWIWMHKRWKTQPAK
ncbi:MAG: lysophospholipid acyltransferase family protein [Planctomycetota bacterium]